MVRTKREKIFVEMNKTKLNEKIVPKSNLKMEVFIWLKWNKIIFSSVTSIS